MTISDDLDAFFNIKPGPPVESDPDCYEECDLPGWGCEWTEEQREEMREMMTGEGNPFYGKKHTEDTKKRLSESKKVTHNSPEFLEKHAARYANKGYKWLSPEGEVVIINTSMNEFCKKHGLNVGRMCQVAQQKPRCKSHKGWRPYNG